MVAEAYWNSHGQPASWTLCLSAMKRLSNLAPIAKSNVVTVRDLHRWITREAILDRSIVRRFQACGRRLVAEDFHAAGLHRRRAKARPLARQADRWRIRKDESQDFHPHQSPAHQVPDHTEYGERVYARRQFCWRVFPTHWADTGIRYWERSCRCGPAFSTVATERSPA